MQPPFRKMFPQSVLKDMTFIDEQRTEDTMKHEPAVVKATKNLCLSTFLSIYPTLTLDALDFKPILVVHAAANAFPPPCSTIESFHPLQLGRESLLRHRIMPSIEPNRSARELNHQISESPIRRNLRSYTGRETAEDYEGSVPLESFIGHDTCKKFSSQLSAKATLPSRNHLPSVSTTSTPSRSATSPSDICLCQPDPKVPRPRNAFILYRQHHQAAVVTQNPGLANPEISKIIGDHWRTSSVETKAHWKGLAEEEKLRHQRQYPDYRYQPKRSGRNSVSNATSSAQSENARCSKCGGKSITSASTIQAQSPSNASTPTMAYGSLLQSQTPTSNPGTGRFPRLMDSPSFPPSPSMRSHPSTANTSPNNVRFSTFHGPCFNDAESPLSSDTKRRRFGNGQFVPIRMSNTTLTNAHKLTPFPFTLSSGGIVHRRESLPRPDFMPSKPQQFTMAAPPCPTHRTSTTVPHHDTSLTLAPLQTSSVSVSEQAKSVEAMVMSIPPLNKIKVLAKISPPLSTPGAGSPALAVRGTVIAIEGTDREGVNIVTKYLEEFLEKDGEYRVRVWDKTPGFADLGAEDGIGRGEGKGEKGFEDYLKLITGFHEVSKEVIGWITTVPKKHGDEEDLKPARDEEEEGRRLSNTLSSSPTTATPTTLPAPDDASSSSSPPPPPQQKQRSPPSTSSPSSLPIALLPHYQLSLTDTSASSLPIADSYAPIDHWQWMATLWRGIVGPDITIVVRPQCQGHLLHGSESGSGQQQQQQPQSTDPSSSSAPSINTIASHPSSEGMTTTTSASSITTPTPTPASTPYPSKKISRSEDNANANASALGGAISPRTLPPTPHTLNPPSPTTANTNTPNTPYAPHIPDKSGVDVRLQDARTVVLWTLGEKELRRVGFEVGEWVRGIGEGNGNGNGEGGE
ncbi:hypothetical protein MMC14_003901 [Varicellaria rhodocarpa]|nr:hypothetical protein [Varicellaria rhodocarpa]